jgi:hypothetical protein
MDKLVTSQLKNKGRLAKLADEKRKEDERTGLHNKLADMTRISSGTLAAKGYFSLDIDVRNAVATSVAAKEAKEQDAKGKREKKEKKATEKFLRVKAKEASGATLTQDNLKTICRGERRDGDPTNISSMKNAELVPLYAMMKARRPSPPPPSLALAPAAALTPAPSTEDPDLDSSDEE